MTPLAPGEARRLSIPVLLCRCARCGHQWLTQQATVTEDITGAIADSINYTIDELRRLVSGINGGLNLGINILYSGTVAGATEGALFDITSIAVSLEYDEHADFDGAAEQAVRTAEAQLATAVANRDALETGATDADIAAAEAGVATAESAVTTAENAVSNAPEAALASR